MKIYEFCPFFNENRVAEIKLKENAKWVDHLHVLEANKTFSYVDKPMNFNPKHLGPKVSHHVLQAEDVFRQFKEGQPYFDTKTCKLENFDQWYWNLQSNNNAAYNEAYQRNKCVDLLRDQVADEDIIILADFDEILDSRMADKMISEVKKHQVISVKLYYTAFYLNYFCSTNHGAPHWSYRVFIMTGRYFKSMPFSADYLRKKGFWGGFQDNIYCLEEPAGFHHSWLDHTKTAGPKLQAFFDNVGDKGIMNETYIQKCIDEKRLDYMDTDIYIDNEKPFLDAVKELRTSDLWKV